MKITLNYIEEAFKKYNELYFNNSLETPMFGIIRRKNVLGSLKTIQVTWYLRYYKLLISDFYDRTEHDFDSTIIHEMIHLYIAQNNIIDNRPHGREFKRICEYINQFGWNIKRTSSIENATINDDLSRKNKYNIIVLKEKETNKQYIMRIAKTWYNKYINFYIRQSEIYEMKHFKSNDIIFRKLTNNTKYMYQIEISDNKNVEFKKYMLET